MTNRAWLALALALSACDAAPDDVGVARFSLEGDAAFFRLRIFKAPPASLGEGTVFDTGCLQQQSRTYEISNVPVGQGYTVVYQGFSAFGCEAAQAVALGYRGGIAITQSSELPYYHVQIYPHGDVATLPEDLNLSASVARSVEFCESAADCGAAEVCYDVAKPEYWCVPSCQRDVDCRAIHVRATCDVSAGWCVLRSPFPLNLSEPRAFGAAATLANGDVLFIGGMRQDGTGALLPTMHPLERFDSRSGLFADASVQGEIPALGSDFGFARLGPDRFVSVGGLLHATMTWGEAGLELESGSADVSADVIVWDLAAGQARSTTLPRGVARPAVIALAPDRLLIAGGLVVSGPGLEATRATTLCTVSAGSPVCEPGPMLQHPRLGAATRCLDAACNRVLVLGGNPGSELAEELDLTAQSSRALLVTGLPNKLFGPVLCGLELVGGSRELARAVPFQPLSLQVGDGTLTGSPLDGAAQTSYLAAVSGADAAFGATPECWLGGGLAGAEVPTNSAAIVRAGGGVLLAITPQLGRARFGAVAATIGGGLLAGKVLFGGGVAVDGAGPVKVVRGAEILSP